MEMTLTANPGAPVMLDKAILQSDDEIKLDLYNGAKLSVQVLPFGFEVYSRDGLSVAPSYMDKVILNCEPQEEPTDRVPFPGVLRFNGMELLFSHNPRFQISFAGGEKVYVRVQDDGLVISRRQCSPIACMATSDNSFYFFILAKDPRLSARTVSSENPSPVIHTTDIAGE